MPFAIRPGVFRNLNEQNTAGQCVFTEILALQCDLGGVSIR
jgi:hypothetical protein